MTILVMVLMAAAAVPIKGPVVCKKSPPRGPSLVLAVEGKCPEGYRLAGEKKAQYCVNAKPATPRVVCTEAEMPQPPQK